MILETLAFYLIFPSSFIFVFSSLLDCDEHEQVRRLSNYSLELMWAHPTSTVMLKFIEATFQCIYVYLEPPKARFLANCRSVKSLDKCFLGGLLGGHLVIAVGIDANDCIYLITCARWVKKIMTTGPGSWSYYLEILESTTFIIGLLLVTIKTYV